MRRSTRTLAAGAGRLWSAIVLVAIVGQAWGAEAPASRAGASIVFLPPQVIPADRNVQTAAELLCDRLAEKLTKAAGVRVVDRTQLRRVLAEHKLSLRPAKPILSYDAMVRLAVDGSGPVPRVEIAVIDLSMGNLIGSKQYAWAGRTDEKLVVAMAELCTSAARMAAGRQDGRIKVRLVSPLIADNIARLEPLAARLERTFEALVGRSAKLRQVHHLEAASAAEESLLLLMGMSRLPGGRRFAPQADATVQLRLREIDALGKTFEQTTVRLDYCVDAPAVGRWQHVMGKVADWDGLIASAWQGVAKRLVGADPKAARDFLNEVALRRRQARAEMAKLHSLRVHDTYYSNFSPDQMRLIADTAAAAAKLDPTNEDAAFFSIKYNFILRRRKITVEKAEPRATMIPVLHEALRQFRTFKGWRAQKAELSHEAVYWVLTGHGDVKFKYGSFSHYHKWRKYSSANPPSLAVLETIRQLVDESLSVPSRVFCTLWENGCQIRLIYEYMLSAGLNPEGCRRWRDEAILRAEANLLRAIETGKQRVHSLEIPFPSLRCIRMGWALEEDQPEKARDLLVDMMRRMRDRRPLLVSVQNALRRQAEQLDDPELASRVGEWVEDPRLIGSARAECFLPIRWPGAELHGVVPSHLPPPALLRTKGAPDRKIHGGYSVQVVGALNRRLYVVFSRSGILSFSPNPRDQKGFGYYPVRTDGRPAGQEMIPLPLPKVHRECWVEWATVCGQHLCVGTDRAGLLAYDPKVAKWTVYGAEQGLPSWYVGRIFPAGDTTLLCYSYLNQHPLSWTLDLASGRVVLRRRMGRRDKPAWAVWRGDGRWVAANLEGMVEGVLARKAAILPWPEHTPQGWDRRSVRASRSGSRLRGPVSVVEVAGRRFLDLPDGLREIDSQGRFLQTWSKCFLTYIEGRPTRPGQRYGQFAMTVPGDLPRGAVIAHDDSVLWYQAQNRLLCYDLAADTWYGPVHLKRLPRTYPIAAVGVRAGVWLGWGPPLFVAKAEFIRQAAGQGKAATTAQLRRQIQESIHSSSALDQAKFALSGHEFEKADRLLTRVLNDNRDHPEALALMGLLHDVACLNKPAEALRYYRRLAALKGNAPAFLTGVYLQCQCHMNKGDLDTAMKTCRQASKWPGLTRASRLALSSIRYNIARAIKERKQAATTKAGAK